MSFSTILFTEKGKALQAKASAGTPLVITKIKMGSGSLSGQSQITLLDLIEPKVVLNIAEIKTSTNFATVKGIFKNSDISTGFYWREIGVFAQDPNIGEILYCYGNAGALAEYIPPSTSEIIEKAVSLSVVIGDAANVSAIIDESLVFATKAELDEVNNKVNIILNTTTICEKAEGTGTAIIVTNIVMEDGYSKTFIVSANNNSATTTINGKKLYKSGTTAAPSLIVGKAVTVWYSKANDCFYSDTYAGESHTHAVSDIANFPMSLPANGGDADTVNGHTVDSSVPANAKFTDTITTINGKTGTITKADITELGIPSQDTVYSHPTTHPPTILSPGSLPENVIAAGPYNDYGASRLRNIHAGTADLTAGSSGLANGTIYIVYE